MTPAMPDDRYLCRDPRPAPIPRRRMLTPLGWAALGTFAALACAAAMWMVMT